MVLPIAFAINRQVPAKARPIRAKMDGRLFALVREVLRFLAIAL
jgi:hypothetical protein